MRFRKAGRGPALPLDAQVRQGRIVVAAHSALGSIDAAREFLNTHHDGLRGRPLDLAVASEDGLKAVEAAIHAERQRSAPGG
ncbi:MAG: antitoxin Xre/MbcA/ParS toxin-binding domain-containing protein [Allosphingosinicella sp.]